MSCLLNRKIERRRNPRRQAEGATVYLSWLGQKRCHCQVIDLSVTGVLVKVGSLGIPDGELIKLVFALPFNSLIKVHYLSAVVVHRSEMGIGLKFQ
ncbi:type IV pilus assembly PilZ [Candidatus Nitrosoglobus terrae]|uniref:Type IV pilus assembly PilZ n=1 Tax=Candidatus Nitrosoglobus terrae TaxID=1630141 RepID=A0A1Q2SL80_9GAMM|nr:PilZ domain-containing protein [Candidatus Nitrosoglobus terrae]BAW79880.1 type IV pilus assembly PilZ [Candidatus Nitrosoglobus terrae]